MSKEMIDLLVLTLLMNQVIQITGKLTILRGPVNKNFTSKVICVSEDDESALVWNLHLSYEKSYAKRKLI